MKDTQPTPAHRWTNGGEEVLVLRFCGDNGSSRGDFKHPLAVGEIVTAPDWNDKPECGGGIHGWPWGIALGDGKEADWSARWQVYGVAPNNTVDLGGKCKFKTGILRYIGDWHGAIIFILSGQIAWVQQFARGAASATGDRGAAIVTALSGRARAGEFGCIALGWWNATAKRAEMRCALTGGKNGKQRAGVLIPHVWYELNESGNFVECERQ